MTKGDTFEQFVTNMNLVLDLDDKYPHHSISVHTMDVVALFLPALLTSCSHRDRVRQIVTNTKLFQCGEWKGFWETDLGFIRRESDNNGKCKDNHDKRDTSIQTRSRVCGTLCVGMLVDKDDLINYQLLII